MNTWMPSTNPLLKGGLMEGHHGQALGEEDPHHGRRHLVVNQVPQPQLRNLTNDHVHICKDPFEIQIFEGGLEQEQGG